MSTGPLQNAPVSCSWRAAPPPGARSGEREELPADWPDVARSQWREGAWSWHGGAGGPAELAAAADPPAAAVAWAAAREPARWQQGGGTGTDAALQAGTTGAGSLYSKLHFRVQFKLVAFRIGPGPCPGSV